MDTKNILTNQALSLNSYDYLTVGQVAALLNLKISRLRYMVFTKQIPFIKIGASVRFSKAQITDWINSKSIEVGE